MQRTGTVLRFDPDRGFGFLHSADSPAEVFFHIRDVDRRLGRPSVGMTVAFDEIHVGGKGPRAMAVRPVGDAGSIGPGAVARPPRKPAPSAPDRSRSGGGPTASLGLFLVALAIELALLAAGLVLGRLPVIVLAVWPVLNLATFWLYWLDKNAAERRAWRVSEQSLHLLSLAGGWAGAWWAQQLLRHKSRKPAFRRMYWATVVGHVALVAAMLGSDALRRLA